MCSDETFHAYFASEQLYDRVVKYEFSLWIEAIPIRPLNER